MVRQFLARSLASLYGGQGSVYTPPKQLLVVGRAGLSLPEHHHATMELVGSSQWKSADGWARHAVGGLLGVQEYPPLVTVSTVIRPVSLQLVSATE
jgi:hypothetical protein